MADLKAILGDRNMGSMVAFSKNDLSILKSANVDDKDSHPGTFDLAKRAYKSVNYAPAIVALLQEVSELRARLAQNENTLAVTAATLQTIVNTKALTSVPTPVAAPVPIPIAAPVPVMSSIPTAASTQTSPYFLIRAKIPDPPEFEKGKPECRTFRAKLRHKFAADETAFEHEAHRLMYALGYLKGSAHEQVEPLVESGHINSIATLLAFLDKTFGDPDQIGTAARELDSLRQGKREF
jgi:hypothetical protein